MKIKEIYGCPIVEQDRISYIKSLAAKNNWDFLCIQENIGMLSFIKEDMRINVYYTVMSVTTLLRHPKKGRGQLYRKNVSANELDTIFKNPRTHTNKGYYQK